MSEFTAKNRDRSQGRTRAENAGKLKKFVQARNARRAVNGAFGRADKDDYEFMVFGTSAEKRGSEKS